jgi:ribosomal protein S27AE
VPTPAVVEGEAEAIPCPACGGKVRAAPHAARVETDVVLRTVRVVCGSCHVARDVYFRVARPLLN